MRRSLEMFLESRMPAPFHAVTTDGVDIHAGHAERTEKIALAAFVHANPGIEQLGMQRGFVAQRDFPQN